MKQQTKQNLKFIGIGTGAGVINGLFGAGSGLLLVPMLSYIGETKSKTAHATTLGCVFFMCISGLIVYIANGVINYKLAIICSIGSLIGALIGTKLLKKLKNNIIDLIFSIILVFAGIFMIILKWLIFSFCYNLNYKHHCFVTLTTFYNFFENFKSFLYYSLFLYFSITLYKEILCRAFL